MALPDVPVASPSKPHSQAWLLCQKCGFAIAPLSVIAGILCLRWGNITVDRGSAKVDCPECGAHRRFVAHPVEPGPVAGAKKEVARPRPS